MSRGRHILLVEDSRTQATKLADALEREGWHVAWAANVPTAMEKLNQTCPDLIVLDYYLPGVRGDELCRRIRMNIATRSIPILMLTMDDTHDAELRGLESGADDFVPKSVDPEILLARIRTLLDKATARSSVVFADQPLRPARLLTIDDSPTYQQFLAAELEQEGFLLESAMSGREGLERIRQESFDCALVDLVMPDMSGIEVCRQVSELRRHNDNFVALLMLTGRDGKDDLTQALEAGADDFVGKTCDMAVLKGRIRALLRRKFFQEDNRRVVLELKSKEMELLRARADKEVAEARAMLNEELERRVDERTAELAEANRQLAQQSREIEMFVYSVSHDLRSPLVNLQGFSKELSVVCEATRDILLESELSSAVRERGLALLDGEMSDSIRFIQTAVMRMSHIIDALLRLSRAGRVEYVRQKVDAERIVQQVVDSMRGTVEEHDAQVTFDHLPPAWGDPTAIEQVFANLIGNALNYLDPTRPGSIEISSQGMLPSTAAVGQHRFLIYAIRDNGLGIDEEYQTKVFQTFQRLHPDRAKGEGIGLSLVRRIVERHGGRVWFESEVGVGSTFFFTLPAGPVPADASDWTDVSRPEPDELFAPLGVE